MERKKLRIKNHTPKHIPISMKKSNIRKYFVPSQPKTTVKFELKAHETSYDKETHTDDSTETFKKSLLHYRDPSLLCVFSFISLNRVK